MDYRSTMAKTKYMKYNDRDALFPQHCPEYLKNLSRTVINPNNEAIKEHG
jgi:hypothetical protein